MNVTLDARYQKELLDLVCDLVRIPTENLAPNGNEREAQEYLKQYLSDMGLAIDAYTPADLPEYPDNEWFWPRNFEGRENVDATWKGTGGGRSLLLSGHIDTATRYPEKAWTVTTPFEPVIRDGKLYGRGSNDMKGGLAAAAIAIKMLKEQGFTPKGDVIFESVVDEEMAGENGSIAGRFRGHNADFAINMEPTQLAICPTCVGGLILKVTVEGTGGMKFTSEQIDSPAFDLARLILLTEEYGTDRQQNITAPDLWQGTPHGIEMMLDKVVGGEPWDYGTFSEPNEAWFEVIFQYYPGEDEEEIIRKYKEHLSAHFPKMEKVRIEQLYRFVKPGITDPNAESVQLLKKVAADHIENVDVHSAMFSCDMAAFTELGKMETVEFGPIGEHLHGPDEWVDVESLFRLSATIADFIVHWCG